MTRLATIDVGTNTTLLLVTEIDDAGRIWVLENHAQVTRLGRGIGGDGRLGREGIEGTLAALTEYAAMARRHGAPIIAVGTEGLRRAPNAGEFLGRSVAVLGVPVVVIDGQREAALTFLAAARSFPETAAGLSIVVDIGGGSTEIIIAERMQIRLRTSLPLGSVRLTERHIRHDPPPDAEVDAVLADIRHHLGPVSFPSGAVVVGTAGTVTTLAVMALGLDSYDERQVHGHRLTLAAIDAQIERLRRATQQERETMRGLDPRRADVILPGACLMAEIARRAGVTEIIVNDRGIRWGLVYEHLGSTAP